MRHTALLGGLTVSFGAIFYLSFSEAFLDRRVKLVIIVVS